MEVVAIFGPTGVGKTAVAVELARLLRERGEDPIAISADALQVYRGLETLTGASDPMPGLEVVLRSQIAATAEFSAGAFAERAHSAVDHSLASGRRPIVVGGTGLYLRAALTELRLKPPPPTGVRERIEADLAVRGPAALHADLTERAPARAAAIDPGDRSRIVRALELLEMGEPIDDYGDQLWTDEMRLPTKLFGLVMEREALYGRIDARVDAMVAAGAADEVRAADAAGASRTARAALGFTELLEGDVDAMKRRTRQYAKRQLTWMRKLSDVELIDVTHGAPSAAAARIGSALS